jgi:decaprenylphospho-beta-D-erythro-pentofuranosid-2-ulose 2-reductase
MQNAVGGVDSILLLGGRSEIGLAIAERLVRFGARRVVLAARDAKDEADLGEAPRKLRAAGPVELHMLDFDATEPQTHREVIREAARLVGDLDVVISAFGVLGDQRDLEGDPAAAARNAEANFTGHISAGLAAAERLRTQGHGTLVALSSVAGVRARRANFVYGAAKAGVDAFAQGLDDALHGSGARVLIVRPGHVHTQMSAHVSAAPFPATSQEVAVRVVDALHHGRRTVWVPRILGPVSVALRLLPRPLWRRLSDRGLTDAAGRQAPS